MLENIANIVTILGVGSLGVGALKFLQDHKEKKEADKEQKKFERLVLLATMRNAITKFASTKHDDLEYQRYAQYIDGKKSLYNGQYRKKKFIQWPIWKKKVYTMVNMEKKVYTMANEDERNLHYLAYLIKELDRLKENPSLLGDSSYTDKFDTSIPKILSSIIDQQQNLLALSTSKQIITFLYSVNKMSNHWAIYAFQDEVGEFEPAAEIILNRLYDIYYSIYMSLE